MEYDCSEIGNNFLNIMSILWTKLGFLSVRDLVSLV